jgi:hypothetical protein
MSDNSESPSDSVFSSLSINGSAAFSSISISLRSESEAAYASGFYRQTPERFLAHTDSNKLTEHGRFIDESILC